MLEGSIGSFLEYVSRHQNVDSSDEDQEGEETIEFRDPWGSAVPVDAKNDAVYMIDLDLPRILPLNYDDFLDCFKVKEILPGGKWCMMNSVSPRLHVSNLKTDRC